MLTINSKYSLIVNKLARRNGVERRRFLSLTAWMEEHLLQRPNPFLQHVQTFQQEQKQNAASTTGRTLPLWDRMQPHHATKATASILKDYKQALLQFSKTRDHDNLSELQSHWQQIRLPLVFYQQSLSVLALAADPPAALVQWQAAHAEMVDQAADVWHEAVLQDEDAKISQCFARGIDKSANHCAPQQDRWLRYWQEQTGGATVLLEEEEQQQNRSEWIKWQTALRDIRGSWIDVKPSQSRAWLPLLYSHVGSRQALARQVMGHSHAAAHGLALRHAQESQIQALHQQVCEKVVPTVMLATEQPLDPRIKPVVCKERTVSLEATLVVLQQLCADVFATKLEFSNQPAKAWHPDVRLLQVSSSHGNDQSSTTTVYLDLFARPGKPNMAATIPVLPGVTVVSMNLEPPVWDTDPVFMSFENLLDFFHEIGHVLQQHTNHAADPSCWPIDWAEVLPKFMEHWLWEPTTLKSLLVASSVDFDDETIQVLYQQARRAKADELARQAFFSATEWEIFTSYNVRGDETIMALTQRLARQYVPHDVPHPTDFGALYQLADANIRNGESAALYRYLWAEAVAAHVFAHSKAAYEANQGVPQKLLRQHICQPTSWEDLSAAFDLSSDSDTDLRLDAMWERYQLG